MKNFLQLLILLLLTASLTSCEKIKSKFNVEIDTTIEGQLNILTEANEMKSTEAYGFNASAPVDVVNEDLVDYEDLIEDFRTKSITVEVLAVDSAGMPISGVEILAGSELAIFSTSNPGYTWPINFDWPIEVGVTATLEADSYSVINDLLEGDETVTFSASGTCNKGNIDITLNYGLKVKVESRPK